MTEEMIRCPKCGTENTIDNKFCQECGNNLKKYIFNKDEESKPFPWILDTFIFFIVASLVTCSVAILLVITFQSESTSQASNILQEISYKIQYVQDFLSLFLGGLIGALFVFCNWSVFKFNRIEKRLADIQNTISKKE